MAIIYLFIFQAPQHIFHEKLSTIYTVKKKKSWATLKF